MQWDPRRYLLTAVLNRVSFFTDLDQNQLNFAGTSVSASNLRIDPQKLSSGSFSVASALIASTLVELGTSGVRISLGGVRIEAQVGGIAPDLGLSIVLEGAGDAATDLPHPDPAAPAPPGFLASTALGQIRLDIHEIELLLHIGDVDLQVDIGSASLELGRLQAEDFVFSVGSEVILHIKSLDLGFDFPFTSATAHIDTVNIKALSALGTVVEIFNVLLASASAPAPVSPASAPATPPSTAPASAPNLLIDQIVIADCALDGAGQFEFKTNQLTLFNLRLATGTLTLEDIAFPGIDIPGPILQVVLGDPICIKLPHPTIIELGINDIGPALVFIRELAATLANLKTPEAEKPAAVDIELSDLRIKVGDFTLILLPQKFNLEELVLTEVLVTCGTDRLVIASPQFDMERKRINVRRITAKLSQHSIDAARAISSSISASDRPLREPLFAATTPQQPQKRPVQSMRLSIDSIVTSIFGYTISSSLVASHGESFRAKLKPEILYENNCINASIQIVFSDILLVYANVLSAAYNLPSGSESGAEPIPPAAAPSRNGSPEVPPTAQDTHITPFTFPFPTEIYIKGQGELVSPIKTLLVLVPDVLNISLKDDGFNAHLPEALIKIKDLAPVPLASIGDVHLRGNLTKNQFATTIGSVEASACADSLNALQRLVQYLQPAPRPPKFAVDLAEDLNIFEDIDHSAFTLKSPPHEAPLQYVENYYPSARAQDSLKGLEELEIQPAALQIQEDYLLELRSASPKLMRHISNRVRLLIKSFTFNLHDGYDFHETRRLLSAAVDRVAAVSDKIGEMSFAEGESPIVGDLMFNSVYIGAIPSRNQETGHLRSEIDRELGSNALARSKAPKLSLRTSKIKGELKSFAMERWGDIISETSLNIEEIMVRDLVPTSKWKALLSYDNSVQGQRKGAMVSVQLEKVSGTDPELRIKANVCPLRIQIDQDTIEFAMRFFEFRPQGIQEEDEFVPETKPQSLTPFIQRFEIADLHICLDYLPKKVDYAGLRSGHAAEFMNLFVVERSKVVLRHLVLHGIAGYANLATSLNNVWTPDVRNNQLVNVLKGLGPLKSMFEVAGGIKKFFVVPVREYKRESGVASGIRRGSTSLAKNTVNELVRLGVRVINGPRKSKEDESALID